MHRVPDMPTSAINRLTEETLKLVCKQTYRINSQPCCALYCTMLHLFYYVVRFSEALELVAQLQQQKEKEGKIFQIPEGVDFISSRDSSETGRISSSKD